MAGGRRVPSEEAIAKEGRVLQLRRAGFTLDKIAVDLGYANRGGAYKALQRALGRAHQESADELRDLEADRLDRLQAAVWQPALDGDFAAAALVIRLSESRRRLLGLDRPVQVHTDHTGELLVQFGIPRPDPVASDAAAVPAASLRALPSAS